MERLTEVEKEKILFIINPISGIRPKGNVEKNILKYLDNVKYRAEFHVTTCKGDATAAVQAKLAEGYTKFVAVGGDGTVNEVASAIVVTEATLGIIPTGSGNGLARHLRIPLNLKRAMAIINCGAADRIDYGMVNKIPFFCTCGVGFDAQIGYRFASNGKRGFFNYIKIVISDFLRYKSKKYKLKIDGDGKFKIRAFLITVANSSQYGNNAYIAPLADIRDGKLNLSIISPFKIFEAPVIGIRLFTKRIDKSTMEHSGAISEVVIKRKHKDVVHYDGEPIIMGKKLKISVVPRGLRVIVPATKERIKHPFASRHEP